MHCAPKPGGSHGTGNRDIAMKRYSTGQFLLSGVNGTLIVRSAAMRHLDQRVNADDEMLVFMWGSQGCGLEERWTVTPCREAVLPHNAQTRGVRGNIGGTPFLVLPSEHYPKLDGRTLTLVDGTLVVQ